MENSVIQFAFLISRVLLLLLHVQVSSAQLSPAESRILFQVQQFLEFPPALRTWHNWTSFCYLPQTPFLKIVCSNNHITELTIVGNKSSSSQIPKISPDNLSISLHTLSAKFSIDSFFTVLTKLSHLQKLSLVSLGLWGPLPEKINRFRSVTVLNLSSNYIYGRITPSVATLYNLRSLVMNNNLLNESVPSLKELKLLEELDLSNNYLVQDFPSLPNNLVRVKLSNNSFRFKIPMNFPEFNGLQMLDLSSCKLNGPIPSFLFSLPSIKYINLSKNQLSGALSANVSCNENLTFLDISNNLLIGNLPSCLGSNMKNKIVISTWNCLSNMTTKYQRPSAFCHKEALVVQPPARKREKSTLKLGFALGIIGGVITILGGLGFLIFGIFRKVRRKTGDDYKHDSLVIDKTSVRRPPIRDRRNVPPPMRLMSLGLPPYHVFTLEEIEDATNNFDPSNLVREKPHGQTYSGRLGDGSSLLVKCIKLKQKHSPQAVNDHMEVISKLRHRHLVSVLGHCIVMYEDHPTTVFIVLENIAKGSLEDLLSDWRRREVLKWPQRMAITLGIARGVQYLHAGGVHGNDLKTGNILLDKGLTAKISNYNFAMLSKDGGEVSENPEKGDVYHLGVILIEVITGKPINSQSEIDNLKFQVEGRLAESTPDLRGLIDPSVRGTFAYESIKTVLQIAVNCLCEDSGQRPTVEDVLWHLHYSVQVQEGWTNSANVSANLSGNHSRNLENS